MKKQESNKERTFKVVVRETLEREVKVQANNEADAIDKVKQEYNDCTIVLNPDDYVDLEIFIDEEDE